MARRISGWPCCRKKRNARPILPNSAINEHARRAIHTLGGIAGTAGIRFLANLSHALEQYWNRFVHVPLPSAHLPWCRIRLRVCTRWSDIESGHPARGGGTI